MLDEAWSYPVLLRTYPPITPQLFGHCMIWPALPVVTMGGGVQGVNKVGDKAGESKCALVFGQMNEPPGARARVALTGLTIAEYFRDIEGQDVLFFVDNIFRFTQVNLCVSKFSVWC